ncbi:MULTISPECIES: type III secretion system outer membrane ring subunit SctC [Pseudomonas syringae group]|uniref:Type 3 secretion system secretin n=1 Tax=Pseudomonas coronafaciens pv. coronafaciens TaxID=235275 RepID=A0AAE6QLP8_9PSED|nr:type III secretion system outer membrane ring subunit SctC [Pseudomonas coronafaciens]KPX33489.1 Outer-membrane type III secretion protein HrcC [Pseudomonas coronafaciens pv. garcae]QGT83270.1 EscC/YscC/HrcC family type III secretion system outer membrane ring protein [Pseudomonas coronafaciens pv. coronafaciens]QIQ71066.1 Yop proteins translocation protein C [Pseudomonas coronafaciens]RMM79703.1 Outer-membrane type III secretion protein HrcC [Pseudomonas coronafaciens pv. striafaciens]RMS8
MRKALMWLPLLLIGVIPATWAVTPEAWKHTAYAYDAQQTELSTALSDFATEFGMALDMSPVQGKLDGRIRADNPEQFLDRLSQEYHFQWFVYNDTLYVSPSSEHTSARIEVSPDAVDDLQTALTDVGLLDKRFGWGALPDEGVVLVRGPAKYVEFVRDYSKKVEKPDKKADKQDVVVLPLKYANAADRTIHYRDQQLVVAGVASILQDLLESRSRGESINSVNLLPGQGAGGASGTAGLPSNGLSYNLGSNGIDTASLQQGIDRVLNFGSKKSSKGHSAGRASIRVSADVRNNSVLIYDLPERKGMYQKLVKELDVPRNLIEIDAVILDIDRNELAELSSRWNFNAGSVSGGANLFDAGTSSTLFIQNAGKFAAELHALEGNGSASVIGNPSILTLENQPAVIDLSRTEYLTATSERAAEILPITAGTSLQVIPRSLDHDGKSQVQMIVDIEDGQIDVSTINDTQPSVRRGNVSTQAMIAEHGSLVIGGFHGLEANDRIHKVPLLGDIPYIGKLLFQSRSRELSQRERLFILTPRLIGDQVNPARYVQNGNPHDVDDQMKRIKQRRDGGELPTRGDIQKVFTQLVDGTSPVGMRTGDALPFETDSLCDPGEGLTLDRQRSQWFAQKDWGVAVVVAHNGTDKPVRIDESRCGGRWVIGVSAWPHAWLQPGEESEVYIAVRQPQVSKMAKESRPSLLKGAKP